MINLSGKFNESMLNEAIEFETFISDIRDSDIKDLASGKYEWFKGKWKWNSSKQIFTLFDGSKDMEVANIKLVYETSYSVTSKLRDVSKTSNSAYIEIGYSINSNYTKLGYINFKGFLGEDLSKQKLLENKLMDWVKKVIGFNANKTHINYI